MIINLRRWLPPPVLVLGLALGLWIGCGDAEEEEAVVDDSPRRIIALAPSVAEVVHALELDDRVVGVGDYVVWPPALASKPKLGGLFNPDFETIVSLRPDVAILLESEASLRGRLEAVDVEVMTVPSDTLADIEQAIEMIGERFGVGDRSDALLRRWRVELTPNPVESLMRVVMVIGREPARLGDMVVAGPGTFFDQLLSRLGAINAFYSVEMSYPQVGVEELLRREPEIILEIQPLDVPESRQQALMRDWEDLGALGELPAPCVRIVQGKHVLVPGPRLPEVYAQLRAAIEDCIPQPEIPEASE